MRPALKVPVLLRILYARELREGTQPNATNIRFVAPLRIAAAQGHKADMDHLVQKGKYEY